MKLLLHLLKKDFLSARLWLILLWSIQLGVACTTRFRYGYDEFFFVILRSLVPPILIFLTMLKVLGEDPFRGTTDFWLTRPIPRLSLFSAKLLFAFVFLLLPNAIFLLVRVALLQVSFSVWDLLLLIMEKTLLHQGMLVTLAILSSVFTRGFAWMVVVALNGLMIFGFAAINLDHLQGDTRYVLWCALCAAAVLCASFLWVRSRRIFLPLVMLVLMTSAGFYAIRHSSGNLSEWLDPKVQISDASTGPLHIEWTGPPTIVSGMVYLETLSDIKRPGRVAGLERGWAAELQSSSSVMNANQGMQVAGAGYGGDDWDDWDEKKRLAFQMLLTLGVSPPVNHPSADEPWILGIYKEPHLAAMSQQPIQIHGTCDFMIYQPICEARLALRERASANAPRKRFVVNRVEKDSSKVHVNFTMTAILLSLRGEDIQTIAPEMILFNPESREVALSTERQYWASNNDFTWEMQQSFHLKGKDGKPVSPEHLETFIRGASLYLIHRRDAGAVSLSYEPFDLQPLTSSKDSPAPVD